MKYYILLIAFVLIVFGINCYNQKMNAKLHYYLSAHPECRPSDYYIFERYPKSKQVAIVKGCAVSHSYAYFVKALIEGEP